MAKIDDIPLVYQVLTIALLLNAQTYALRQFNLYQKYHIEDVCFSNQSVVYFLDDNGLHSAVWISASRFSFLQAGRNCSITLRPPPAHGIILSVEYMAFGYPSEDGCTDYLKVTSDGKSAKLCGNYRAGDVQPFTSKHEMNLLYHTSKADVFFRGAGFTIIATVYSREHSVCGEEQFKCNNSRCIWEYFACDGMNNCGDKSDEEWKGRSQCHDIPDFTISSVNMQWPSLHSTFPDPFEQKKMTTTATAVVCLLFIFMIVLLRVYCYRWNLKHNSELTTHTIDLRHRVSTREINSDDDGLPPPSYDSLASSQQFSEMINLRPPPYSVVVLNEERKKPQNETRMTTSDEKTSEDKKIGF